MNGGRAAVPRRVARLGAALALTGALAAALDAAPIARAETLLVVDDFAPMRMVPSRSAPHKAFAPLGLLLESRRVSSHGDFIEATNGEERPFEDPAWLHYWIRPSSVLQSPGATKVSLDLVLEERAGPPERGAPPPLPGRRYSVADFIADSTALPDSYYVAAGDANDPSPWGGRARILPVKGEPYDPPGAADRKAALRAEGRYQLYVTLLGPKPIRSVEERLAVARVLVDKPSCADFEYEETEVMTLAERTRKIGGAGNTVPIAVPVAELTATKAAPEVLWSRLVYVATVTFEDGSAETIARRLLVTWPLCP
jgi:hypothetical protein